MPASRRRDLLINLFLWLAPLGGVMWIMGTIARHEIDSFINAQGTGVWAVPSRLSLVNVSIIFVAGAILAIFSRRKLGFAAGLSLFLLALATWMWVRSHYHTDYYCHFRTSPAAMGRERIAHEIKSTAGGVRFMRFEKDGRDPKLVFWETWTPQPFPELLSGKSSDPAGLQYPSQDFPERNEPSRLRDLGFDFALNPNWARYRFSSERTDIFAAPYWFLCFCFLPLPLLWTRRHLRRRRIRHRKSNGLCTSCGYNLRASPLRCPECGLAVEKVNER